MSGVLLYQATGGLALLAALVGWLGHRWAGLAGALAASAATFSGLLAVAARWTEAGHLPLFGTYEASLSMAVVVLGTGLLGDARLRRAGSVSPGAAAIAAALLGHGLTFDRTSYALTISERSLWMDLHAVVAWLTFAALTVNVTLAVRCLTGRSGLEPWLAPSLQLGFFLHTAMLASGSWYKYLLFGRLWSFDPIETLGLGAWLAYGALIHLHLLASWSGRRLARWCLLTFVLLVVSYKAIVYFPPSSTYHIFDMDRRIHVMGS